MYIFNFFQATFPRAAVESLNYPGIHLITLRKIKFGNFQIWLDCWAKSWIINYKYWNIQRAIKSRNVTPSHASEYTNYQWTKKALFGMTQLSLMGKLILFDSDLGPLSLHRISASVHCSKNFVMLVPTHPFKICNFTRHNSWSIMKHSLSVVKTCTIKHSEHINILYPFISYILFFPRKLEKTF